MFFLSIHNLFNMNFNESIMNILSSDTLFAEIDSWTRLYRSTFSIPDLRASYEHYCEENPEWKQWFYALILGRQQSPQYIAMAQVLNEYDSASTERSAFPHANIRSLDSYLLEVKHPLPAPLPLGTISS